MFFCVSCVWVTLYSYLKCFCCGIIICTVYSWIQYYHTVTHETVLQKIRCAAWCGPEDVHPLARIDMERPSDSRLLRAVPNSKNYNHCFCVHWILTLFWDHSLLRYTPCVPIVVSACFSCLYIPRDVGHIQWWQLWGCHPGMQPQPHNFFTAWHDTSHVYQMSRRCIQVGPTHPCNLLLDCCRAL